MSEAIPAMLFDEVKGSMTSPDGQTVFLRADIIDGDDLLLGFPHKSIGTMIENLAAQLPYGQSDEGDKIVTAFFVSGYEIGTGPNGEPVLVLPIGEIAKINFVMTQEMVASLSMELSRVATKN
jgi:hypothetical protein